MTKYLIIGITLVLFCVGLFILNRKVMGTHSTGALVMAVVEFLLSNGLLLGLIISEKEYGLQTYCLNHGGELKVYIYIICFGGILLKVILDSGVYMFIGSRFPNLLSAVAIFNGVIPLISYAVFIAETTLEIIFYDNSFTQFIESYRAIICDYNRQLSFWLDVVLIVIPILHLLFISFGVDKFEAQKPVRVARVMLRIVYRATVGVIVYIFVLAISFVGMFSGGVSYANRKKNR